MTEKQLKRISELTAISRTRELTAEEREARAELRRLYLESVRSSLRGQLEQIEFTD